MKIAALYDVHGNLPALEAVLHACRKAGADTVVLGGDLAAGPLPAETLEIIIALGDWAVGLQGAADRAVVACYDLLMAKHRAELDAQDPLAVWAAGRITRRQRDYLAGLPGELRFPSEDLGELYFYHALPGSSGAALRLPPGAQVIVAGDGHRQGEELQDGRRIVHPGSVGMAEDGTPGARWALFGEKIELQRTPYDTAQAARRIVRCGMPGAEAWTAQHVLRHEARS